MLSKKLYIQLIIRSSLLAVTALGFAFAIVTSHYFLSFLMFLLFVGQLIFLIRYINTTNTKIAYFFNAIKNEDFTLTFSETDNTASLNELHQSLNMLNKVLKKIHLKNQTQEQYYQEILKQTEIGILTCNTSGHILFKNPKVEQLLNYSPLNHINQLQQVDEHLFETFKTLQPFDRKLIKLTNERETIELAIKSTQIVLDHQKLLLLTIQDIHNELDVKETDSWVRLIRVLTHEIMNSVTPITSISESILGYYKTGNDVLPIDQIDEAKILNTAKGLEVIKNQGNDLMSFVQSYRSFLNVPAPDKKIIKVADLLEKVELLIAQETGFTAIDFSIDCIENNMEIYADEKQISQILVNLCKNAIQSMHETTLPKLSIQAGITSDHQKFISVKDNGPGIPEALINEIFVPFFTTKKEGTGIGLSLSKQIMHLHQGRLTVHSKPHQETVFTLYFRTH